MGKIKDFCKAIFNGQKEPQVKKTFFSKPTNFYPGTTFVFSQFVAHEIILRIG